MSTPEILNLKMEAEARLFNSRDKVQDFQALNTILMCEILIELREQADAS